MKQAIGSYNHLYNNKNLSCPAVLVDSLFFGSTGFVLVLGTLDLAEFVCPVVNGLGN